MYFNKHNGESNLKCELCEKSATEKHHITYFPEVTVGVCKFHGDEIHRNSDQYATLLLYKKNEAHEFYSQQQRISKFLRYLSHLRKQNRK